MNKVEKHKQLCDKLNEMYIKKNNDYGDSVHDTFVRYGLTSFLVRMEDKLNRARTLSQNVSMVNDEKITDTLLDLANYSLISVLELQVQNNQMSTEYCSNCGVQLDEHNKALKNMCNECKYGIDWEE